MAKKLKMSTMGLAVATSAVVLQAYAQTDSGQQVHVTPSPASQSSPQTIAQAMTPARAPDGIAELPAVSVTGTRDTNNSLQQPTAVGSRLGLTIRETPASISRMDSISIEERGITRLQDAAVRMPGLSSAAGAGNGGTALTSRGFTGPGSVVQMIDGTRLIVGAGTVSFPVSTWPIETVEVLRGPSSVLFGDGAIGGAVNYVTKRPTTDYAEHTGFATLGSYNTYRIGVGSRGPINEQWSYAAYADVNKHGGYIDKTDYSIGNFSGSLQYKPDGRLTVLLSADASHQDGVRYRGTPVRNGQLDPRLRRANFNVSDSDLEFRDHWVRMNVEYALSDNVQLRNEIYHLTANRHFRDVQNYAYLANGNIGRSRYVDIFHEQTQVGNRFDASISSTIGGMKNRLTVGVDAYRVQFAHINNSAADGSTYGGNTTIDPFNFVPGLFSANPRPTIARVRTNLRTVSVFAEDALDLTPELKLVTGLRQDNMNLDALDVVNGVLNANVYKPLTGRAGLVWSPSSRLSLYGQYATGVDPAASLLTLTAANARFTLAKGQQIEIGAKGSLADWRGEWTLAAYSIKKTDLIATDPATGLPQQIGGQSARGVEVSLSVEPIRGWNVDFNAALLRAQFDSFFETVGGVPVSRSGKTPPNVPQRMANLWSTYRFAQNWQAGAGLQFVGARPGDNANMTRVPSYTLLDLTMSYQATKTTKLQLAVRNATNKSYGLTTTNNNNQWILGDPRMVELTARVAF